MLLSNSIHPARIQASRCNLYTKIFVATTKLIPLSFLSLRKRGIRPVTIKIFAHSYSPFYYIYPIR
jgi:hypothetical protein